MIPSPVTLGRYIRMVERVIVAEYISYRPGNTVKYLLIVKMLDMLFWMYAGSYEKIFGYRTKSRSRVMSVTISIMG